MKVLILCFLVFTLATFVQRVSGFGIGVIAIMFLPYILSSHMDAAALSNMISFLSATIMVIRFRKDVPWKVVFPLLVGSYVMVFLSIRFSAVVSFDILEKILGVTLIGLSLYFIFFSKKISIRPTFLNGLLAGSLGGILSGLFGAGGPPIALYLSSTTSTYAVYFASIQAYFMLNTMYALTVRVFSGLIHPSLFVGFAGGVLGNLLGNLLGEKAAGKIPKDKFKQIVYGMMAFSGLVMLF